MSEDSQSFTACWYALSPLPLEVVCSRLMARLTLPEFEFDCEIDTRWAISELNGIKFNVTHWMLSQRERLEELRHGLPDHNFVVFVDVPPDHPHCRGQAWLRNRVVPELSRVLSDVFQADVYFQKIG
jgi:hypothetical protein